MIFTLKDAAEYFKTAKAPQGFLALIRQIKNIFTFPQERANRLKRYGEVTKAYKDGMMITDIENKYGCSRHTIYRYAKLAGLPKRPKSDDPERHAKIIKLSREGKSQIEIAKLCNCTISLVSQIEHKAALGRYKNSRQVINEKGRRQGQGV